MRRWLLLGLVFSTGLIMGGLGGWSLGLAQSERPREEGVSQGQRPPRFTAHDLSGARHSLEQYTGRILVLHFWASWCPFCRSQIPDLRTLSEEWLDKGVAVLTVGLDHDVERLRQFIDQEALPYPVIADAEQGAAAFGQRYHVTGIPDTFVIGRDGRIVSRHVGRADLISAVQGALEGSSGSSI